jgi:hypothetical protein
MKCTNCGSTLRKTDRREEMAELYERASDDRVGPAMRLVKQRHRPSSTVVDHDDIGEEGSAE